VDTPVFGLKVQEKMTTSSIQVRDEHQYLAPRPLDTLRAALKDVQKPEDMNNSPFRHVMVISETLDILHEQLKRNNPQRPPILVYVSSFSGGFES
jgi:hypothetical protein